MKKIDYLSTLFVGIDIGSRTNVVSAIDFHQEYFIKMKSIPNAQGGAELLEDMIADVLNRHRDFHYVIIGLESTGFYGVHIANYLSSCNKLAPFSTHVYCLNPKEVANYKASFNSLDKNDGIDSFVIADFARVGRINIQPWRGSQYLALQRLTRHRLHITECIAREKTYLLNNIFLKFSEFAMLKNEEHPFSNKYGATAEALLTEFMTNEDLVNSSTEELIEFISRKSRNRISNPAETASLIQAAARNSYILDKCLYEPLTVSISSSFNCISAFKKELKAIDVAILRTVKGLNPTEYLILNSIPGIGKVYSAAILAEIGSIKCFRNNNSLAKYCGIVWKENQSGNFKADNTPMSKAGNRYLRYYIIEATNSVIRNCPEYKAFYDKKYAEVTTHQHKRALALTSRKFLRMLFGLLDKSQLYSLDKSR
ncbi:IS110 family RNA-guided transposase [Vallitalea maricola]|uniref:IS110-like element ISDha12 family transposase n=1 Tax=Vallitalea maricola TaxID=3074433 RepID=A0ACB5URP0_9FIRM|nr:IS110-like element ISDha12 family transposase [Vallitalea sp. AN17-2]